MSHEDVPHSVSLTPLSELLDRIIRLLRQQGLGLMMVAAAPSAAFVLAYGVVVLVLHPWQPAAAGSTVTLTSAQASCVYAVLIAMTLLWLLCQGAATQAALCVDQDQHPALLPVYRVTIRRFGTLLGLMVLRVLLLLAPVLVCVPVAGVGALAWFLFHGQALGRLGWFLLIPALIMLYLGWCAYVVYIFLRLSLAVPAALAEELGPRAALRRSGQLTRGVKGRIFLVALVVYAASYACFMVFFVLLMVVASLGALLFSLTGIQLAHPYSLAVITLLIVGAGLLIAAWIAFAWALYGVTFSVLYRDRVLQSSPVESPGE